MALGTFEICRGFRGTTLLLIRSIEYFEACLLKRICVFSSQEKNYQNNRLKYGKFEHCAWADQNSFP